MVTIDEEDEIDDDGEEEESQLKYGIQGRGYVARSRLLLTFHCSNSARIASYYQWSHAIIFDAVFGGDLCIHKLTFIIEQADHYRTGADHYRTGDEFKRRKHSEYACACALQSL